MAMTSHDIDLTTIPGWKAHKNAANRILELEKLLKEARAYNAELLMRLDNLARRPDELEPGWYVVCEGNWDGPKETKEEALKLGQESAQENPAFTVKVEARYEPPEMIDEDEYNGVQRGVDYPYTLARGMNAHAAA